MNGAQNVDTPKNYSGVGFLVVKISTAKGAIPISGALVTVSGTQNGDNGVYAVVMTDSDGIARKIPIPAPPKSSSESSGQNDPYATYGLEVVKAGYYSETLASIPIFDTVTSVQNVFLVPLSSGNPAGPDTDRNTDLGDYFDSDP